MRRFLLPFSAILFSTLSVVLFVSSSASAATIWDNAIVTIDQLIIKRSNGDTTDISLNYMGLFQECAPDMYSLFQDAMNNGGHWAITTWRNSPSVSDERNVVRLAWTSNTSAETFFVSSPTGPPDSLSVGSVAVPVTGWINLIYDGVTSNFTCSTNNGYYNYSIIGHWANPGNYNGGDLSLFLSTYPVTYPDGYQGAEIPTSHLITSTVKPLFDYSVSDRNLVINFQDVAPDIKYYYGWQFSRYNDQDNGNLSDVTQILTDWSDPIDTLHLRADNRGRHVFMVGMCETRDTTDDSCDYVPNSELTIISVNLNRQYYSGSSGDIDKDDCVIDDQLIPGLTINHCGISAFEQCDIDGWTGLPAFFACQISNFFTGLSGLMIYLFVPDSYNLRQSFTTTLDQIKTSLGFIYAPVDFIVQLFDLAINGVPDGDTCAIGPLSFFGSEAITIHMCAWRYQLPTLWSTMQISIQGGIVLSFIFVLYRSIMRLFGHNIDDDDATIFESETYSNTDGKEHHTHSVTSRKRRE